VCLKGGYVGRGCTSRLKCIYCKKDMIPRHAQSRQLQVTHRNTTTARPTPTAGQAKAQTRPVSTNLYMSQGEGSQTILSQTGKAQVHK